MKRSSKEERSQGLIRIFIVYKPKFIYITKEIDREVRQKFGTSEIILTLKKTRGIMAHIAKLKQTYKVDDVRYGFFIPTSLPPPKPISSLPPEKYAEVCRKISESKKGKPRDEETRRKISAGLKGIKRERTKAEKLMYASFRSKLGKHYKWIFDPYSGQEKQIGVDEPLPEGFLFGRSYN
ncbi:MAG: hypothetical protein EBR82_85515, partial [Caulobacteraceae bacterium]|nr:hypothetical protein [Caulobacteraceae bacterium]